MTNELLDLLRVEVPREIEARVPATWAAANNTGRCVQAAHVGVNVLRYFGVEAKPLVTLMMAGNEAWAEWMLAGSPQPMPDAVWSVGIDPNGDKYAGHVVIEVDGQLLDLDAGFYSRPQRGMPVPATMLLPLVQVVPDGPIAAGQLEGGGAIVYGRHPSPPNFYATGAWKHTGTWAGPVIRRMREAVLHL